MLPLSSSPAGKLRATMDYDYSAPGRQDQDRRPAVPPMGSTVAGPICRVPGYFARRERMCYKILTISRSLIQGCCSHHLRRFGAMLLQFRRALQAREGRLWLPPQAPRARSCRTTTTVPARFRNILIPPSSSVLQELEASSQSATFNGRWPFRAMVAGAGYSPLNVTGTDKLAGLFSRFITYAASETGCTKLEQVPEEYWLSIPLTAPYIPTV